MTSILKKKKISETPFRKEVLQVFKNYDNAIPLAVVEEELTQYDRITLYRTIKTFLNKGIIHEIAISGQESNYAMCSEECDAEAHQHQHVHFKCSSCGVVSCVEVDKFPPLAMPGFTVDQLEIQASGLCQSCNT